MRSSAAAAGCARGGGFCFGCAGACGVRKIFAIKSVRNRREGERKDPNILAFPFRFGLWDSERVGLPLSGQGSGPGLTRIWRVGTPVNWRCGLVGVRAGACFVWCCVLSDNLRLFQGRMMDDLV